MKEALFGKTLKGLRTVAAQAGLPPFTASQLADWLYKKNADSFEGMSNLSRSARAYLKERFSLDASPVLRMSESRDGTKKYLFRAGENGFVEAVFIPEDHRNTLCLSVQIGCKMGCLFCMTGKQGFQGNLSAGEILNQYRSLPERDSLTNIVYMGMGEPLDNLENVLDSLEILCSPYGYTMSPSRVTVSTVGIMPELIALLERSRCHIALSLHSPFEEERRRLVPVEKRYPVKEILNVLRRQSWPIQRRISFEYILFHKVNDTPRHARELVRLLHGIRCRVNLIAFHPIPGVSLEPSSWEKMEEFQENLKRSGIMTTIRKSRGQDISAACGLLSTEEFVKLGRPDTVSPYQEGGAHRESSTHDRSGRA
jgi:23S rRNA (adenine2503-C2)-methyltransferase